MKKINYAKGLVCQMWVSLEPAVLLLSPTAEGGERGARDIDTGAKKKKKKSE